MIYLYQSNIILGVNLSLSYHIFHMQIEISTWNVRILSQNDLILYKLTSLYRKCEISYGNFCFYMKIMILHQIYVFHTKLNIHIEIMRFYMDNMRFYMEQASCTWNLYESDKLIPKLTLVYIKKHIHIGKRRISDWKFVFFLYENDIFYTKMQKHRVQGHIHYVSTSHGYVVQT